MPARIREAKAADYNQIKVLLENYDIEPKDEPQWSELWQKNPSHPSSSYGWVIENDGKIVGYLGSIPLTYWYGKTKLQTYTTHAWAVDKNFRSHSLPLVMKFISQKSDLLLNTTARKEAGEIFEALKFLKVPLPWFQNAFLWITNANQFTRSVLIKKNIPAFLRPFFYILIFAFLKLRTFLVQKSLALNTSIQTKPALTFDEKYDFFWKQTLDHHQGLLADRSLETLRWHWQSKLDSKVAVLFEATKGSDFLGYLILLRQDNADFNLTRFRIADIQIHSDLTDTLKEHCVRALTHSALQYASASKVAIVETVGHPAWLRDILSHLHPLTRELESWPFYYKTNSVLIKDGLKNIENWCANLYDGDSSL